MTKRKDYSRASFKSKPISIRYNIRDFEAACEISGKKTVQSMFDFLLQRYLVEKGEKAVAPIESLDTRPVDKRIFKWHNNVEAVLNPPFKKQEEDAVIIEKGGFQIRIEVKESLGGTQ